MERLKFFFSPYKAFYYNKVTGGGMALESYNLLTDRVTIRYSLFGLVTKRASYPRGKFLRTLENKDWVLR